jgi:small subunit ribosomal protein S21
MIYLRDDEPLVKALKRFQKHVEKSGIMGDVRKHAHYVKPSERRRRKRKAAERRLAERRRGVEYAQPTA